MASLDEFALPEGEKLWEEASKPDPMPAMRRQVIKGIDKAIMRLDKPRVSKVDWFTKLGDMATLTVQVGGQPINFYKGTPGMIVKLEHAKAAYEVVKKMVDDGELDEQIKGAWTGDTDGLARATRTGGFGKKRGPMSQDTKDKIAAARLKISVEEYRKQKGR
jgi:hypothetical protein